MFISVDVTNLNIKQVANPLTLNGIDLEFFYEFYYDILALKFIRLRKVMIVFP